MNRRGISTCFAFALGYALHELINLPWTSLSSPSNIDLTVAVQHEEQLSKIDLMLQKIGKLGNQTTMPQVSKGEEPKKPLSVDSCRDVFSAQGQGGNGEVSSAAMKKACGGPLLYGVCDDLQDFTGLTESEFGKRMQRRGQYHFEGEHLFWNSQSKTELAWFYATSVNYLFANAIHAAVSQLKEVEDKKYEPVLDYSGGVGNNVLHLAKKGIKVQYFGIGMAEYAFTRFRVAKHNLKHLVEFKLPYSSSTQFKFNPIDPPLSRDGSLGAIIAMDVLEHIPDYHRVVEAMVESIRVGGIILENTPFGKAINEKEEDLRVHLAASMPMEKAMGPKMKKIKNGVWEKTVE